MVKKNLQLKGKTCTICNGSGTVRADVGGFMAEVDCSSCHGTGIIQSSNACSECKGSGIVIADVGGFNAEVNCSHCNGSGLEP